MSNLKRALTEALTVLDPYKKDIKYFIVANQEGGHTGSAFTGDGLTYIRAVFKQPITEVTNTASLGSLPYLKAILDAEPIKADDCRVEVEELVSADGVTRAVGKLTFIGKKLKAAYQASDPMMVQALQIAAKTPRPMAGVCSITVDKATAKDFDNAARIYLSYDNKLDHCRIEYKDGMVTAEFGDRAHRSTVTLAENVPGEDTTVSTTFLIDDVKKLLNLAAIKGGKLSLLSKYLKLELEQEFADYMIIAAMRTPAKAA